MTAKSFYHVFRSILRELKVAYHRIFDAPNFVLDKMDYDRYHLLRGYVGIRHRFHIFKDLIENGASVLDIGCGDGTLLKYLSENKKIRGYGIDISSTAIEETKKKGFEAKIGDITSSKFNIEGIFDYIILSEVIEHIPRPEDLLLKLRGHFKKFILVSFPNIAYYPYRLRLLLGRFPIQWAYHPGEHLRFWSIPDFKSWVESLNFYVEKFYVSEGFPYLANLFPNLLGHDIVFIVKKKTDNETKAKNQSTLSI